QLLEEAEELIKQSAGGEKKMAAAAGAAGSEASAVAVGVIDEAAPLHNFYQRELKPFLEKPGARGSALGDAAQARSAFAQLRTLVPASLHPRSRTWRAFAKRSAS